MGVWVGVLVAVAVGVGVAVGGTGVAVDVGGTGVLVAVEAGVLVGVFAIWLPLTSVTNACDARSRFAPNVAALTWSAVSWAVSVRISARAFPCWITRTRPEYVTPLCTSAMVYVVQRAPYEHGTGLDREALTTISA